MIPQRWAEVRQPSPQELQGTLVLSLPWTEASAKIRSGPPLDDKADYLLPVWAGVLPLELTTNTPVKDPHLAPDVTLPNYVKSYKRGVRI